VRIKEKVTFQLWRTTSIKENKKKITARKTIGGSCPPGGAVISSLGDPGKNRQKKKKDNLNLKKKQKGEESIKRNRRKTSRNLTGNGAGVVTKKNPEGIKMLSKDHNYPDTGVPQEKKNFWA